MTSVKELMNLAGRNALVTGAAGGIGRVIALTLAELGASLTLTDRPGADYSALIKELESASAKRVEFISCDLESESERKRLIESIGDGAGALEILVNNAAFVGTTGLTGWATTFEKQTTETWRRALEVNLTAVFDLSRGLSPLLVKSGKGTIINIASIYGSYGPDNRLYDDTSMGNPAAYAASKGGLIQFTRWLATTLAPKVRVNAISPGGVLRGQPAEFVARYKSRTPLGRMASENDFSGAMAYLASDLSSYVTGHVLAVDGGWGIW